MDWTLRAPRSCTFTAAGPTGTFPTHAEAHHSPSVPVRNPATLIPSLTPPHSQIPPKVFASYCTWLPGCYLSPNNPTVGLPAPILAAPLAAPSFPSCQSHYDAGSLTDRMHGSPADILPFSSFLSSDLGVSSTSSGSKGPCPLVLPCSAPPPR